MDDITRLQDDLERLLDDEDGELADACRALLAQLRLLEYEDDPAPLANAVQEEFDRQMLVHDRVAVRGGVDDEIPPAVMALFEVVGAPGRCTPMVDVMQLPVWQWTAWARDIHESVQSQLQRPILQRDAWATPAVLAETLHALSHGVVATMGSLVEQGVPATQDVPFDLVDAALRCSRIVSAEMLADAQEAFLRSPHTRG